MTRRIALSLLGLTALVGCGGGGGDSTANTVTGIVFDSENGDLEVQGATVTMGGVSGVTRTNDNASINNPVGSITLQNVPIGTTTATIQLAGGGTQTVGFLPSVTRGANGLFSLYINIGQLRGRVLRSDGKPASGAFVTYLSTLRSERLQTDSNGNFLFPLVPKGEVQVEAQQGTATKTLTVTTSNGVLELGDIQLVDDANPSAPGLPFTIRGTVTQSGGGVLAGIDVFLFKNDIQRESVRTASDGTYRFYVAAGNYVVKINDTTFAPQEKPASLVSTNQPITVDFALTPR
jgi:hypothetical protein